MIQSKLSEKLAKAKKTNWVTKGLSEEEVQFLVKSAQRSIQSKKPKIKKSSK